MSPRFRRAGVLLLLAGPVSVLQAQGAGFDRAPSRFALSSGVRIHYKSLGLGTTAVVFVHGWNCDLTFWRAQIPAVDGRVRAIFLDLPGFGRSDKPDVAYTMDYFAGAIDAVLQAAGVTRAVLVGHSLGAPAVRQYYRRFRSKVAALVVVDGPLRSPFGDSAQTARFVAQWEGPDYAERVSGMVDGLFATSADTVLRAAVKRQMQGTPQRVAASAMRGMADPAIWRDDPIEVPVLAVMSGRPLWSPDYVAYVKRLAPGVRYETMAGVGHFLMLERPAEFNAILDDFLREQRVIR
jgi:pimeloyl-ACP methyl ester carboxylesterase